MLNSGQISSLRYYSSPVKLALHVMMALCRVDVEQWSNLITALLQQSSETCTSMVEFLATDGNSCIKYVYVYLSAVLTLVSIWVQLYSILCQTGLSRHL